MGRCRLANLQGPVCNRSPRVLIFFVVLLLPLTFVFAEGLESEGPGAAPVVSENVIGDGEQERAAEAEDSLDSQDGREPAAQKKNKKSSAKKKSTLDGLVIGSLEVEGNRKIETDAIVARIGKLQAGKAYRDSNVSAAILDLFKSDYFNQVEIYKEVNAGRVRLLVKVVEKPSIFSISYEGNDAEKDEDLAEATGLKSFELLHQGRISEAQEKLQKYYENKGYFLAKVESKITEIKKDESVKLEFIIEENEKVKVKKINFLGNTKLQSGFLKDAMITKEGGYFSFMSGSGAFKQDAFDYDVRMLRQIYYSQGYVNVKIDRPMIYVSPDKKGLYITIRIDEGDQFSVGRVDFSGDLLYTREELFSAIQIDDSKIFSFDVVKRDLDALQEKYGDLGYAFANPIPKTRVLQDEKKVDIEFELDKGNKVYFGRIDIVGNSKTRDKVIRRELKIFEGELYHASRRRESLEAIKRLGFFEDVNFKTSSPESNPDLLNVEIEVKERNTGSLQLGAGYGSSTGLNFTGQISQSNFLGKGQNLAASLNLNSLGNFYEFRFTEPYFLDTSWLFGVEVYQKSSGASDYNSNTTGGKLKLGYPVFEEVMGFFTYRYDYTKLTEERDRNDIVITDRDLFPLEDTDGVTSAVGFSIEYDTRNDRFAPSRGMVVGGSIEYAGLGGDLNYTKSVLVGKYFRPLFWDVVWRNNLVYGIVRTNNSDPTPFNQLFNLGGPYDLRGYRFDTVGRRRASENYYNYLKANTTLSDEQARILSMRQYGGEQQLYYSLELEFPLIAEAKIKGVVFYDVGQAEDQITDDQFFSDIGFGFRWFSPLGPLRFEWGFPLNRDVNFHEPSNFEFSIGNSF